MGRVVAIIIAGFSTVFVAFAIRYSYGLLLPDMLTSLAITKTEAGVIFSAYFFTYTIFSPLLGLLVDRTDAQGNPHRIRVHSRPVRLSHVVRRDGPPGEHLFRAWRNRPFRMLGPCRDGRSPLGQREAQGDRAGLRGPRERDQHRVLEHRHPAFDRVPHVENGLGDSGHLRVRGRRDELLPGEKPPACPGGARWCTTGTGPATADQVRLPLHSARQEVSPDRVLLRAHQLCHPHPVCIPDRLCHPGAEGALWLAAGLLAVIGISGSIGKMILSHVSDVVERIKVMILCGVLTGLGGVGLAYRPRDGLADRSPRSFSGSATAPSGRSMPPLPGISSPRSMPGASSGCGRFFTVWARSWPLFSPGGRSMRRGPISGRSSWP